ncbi:MAG: gamma carbonic anhydrase family protein [Nitrospirae bacterium]|nr:gamma carbonic anhydrase family protein [Nitrospirota bacterium]
MPLWPFHGIQPRVPASVFVAPNAYVIGDVTLGEEASIWFAATVRGDVNPITIGARTNIQDGSVVHATKDKWVTRIGANVTVGHAAVLHGCVVADHVLVGMRAVVLDGAEVGEFALIAAGSLVTEGMKIPPRSVVMGSPAKVVRSLRPVEEEWLRLGAENYVAYALEFSRIAGSR